MSSRKNRLSLSKDVHKDKEAKTPIPRRTSSRTAKSKPSPDSQRHNDSYEVSPSQGSDYSPLISLTQDTSFHAINGVSWEWNSPHRLREQQRVKIATATNHHHIKRPLRPKYSDIPDTAPVQKPTGFNKFISKLNLLMEKENVAEEEQVNPVEPVSDDLVLHTDLLLGESCFVDDFSVESDPKATGQSEDSDDDIFQKHAIESPIGKRDSNNTAAELDDSKLDNLLIEASQTIEEKLNKPISPQPQRSSTPPPPKQQTQPGSRVKEISSHVTLPMEMNDSDMDGFLVQASLMVEEKLSDSSQESSSNNGGQKAANHRPGVVSSNHAPLPGPIAEQRDAKSSTSSNSEGTKEITISQEELKLLIEKKRQEALRRLQNNRLKRGLKGANTHG